MKKVVCQSVAAGVTRAYGRKLADRLTHGGTLLLYGELGAGKTTFVQGLAEGLGVQGTLTSPTFTLVNVYAAAREAVSKLVHIDLYRLTSSDRLAELDVETLQQEPNTLLVVEWPERAPGAWHNVVGTIHFSLGETISLRRLEINGSITPLFEAAA